MQLSRSTYRLALALGIACSVPAAAHAAVVYNEIIVQDALGTVLASVTASPSELANPDGVFYVRGIAVDESQYGNYGIVLDGGTPSELFGISNKAPDGYDLAFALQNTAENESIQNTVDATGAPIDMTRYLAASLRTLGDTASFIVSAPNSAVPEPVTWAMMVVGFGAIGAGLRRKTRNPALRASS